MNISKKNKEFMESILPKSGRICVCKMIPANEANKARMEHEWFDNTTDAVNYINDDKTEPTQFFFAPASFKQSERQQVHAKLLRVFFLDIDCGPDKPYPTRKEGKRALRAFCKKNNLPLPTLVNVTDSLIMSSS